VGRINFGLSADIPPASWRARASKPWTGNPTVRSHYLGIAEELGTLGLVPVGALFGNALVQTKREAPAMVAVIVAITPIRWPN